MNFIKESIEEFRKVTWPTRNQAVTLSIIVIIFTAVSTLVFLGADKLFRSGYDVLLETSTKVQNEEPIQVETENAQPVEVDLSGENFDEDGVVTITE